MTTKMCNASDNNTNNSQRIFHYLLLIGLLFYYAANPLPASAFSEELAVSINQVKAGQLLFHTESRKKYQPALLLHTDMNLEVNGMVARINLKQRFKNTSEHWVEGIYVFPLPENAAVNKMHIQIDERIIEGKIKEKKEAKIIYQQARAAGKQASLVEQERPNLFTNTISNIAPGKEIIIEISYLQNITYHQGEFELRFPMTITPRFIPGKILAEQLGDQALPINQGNCWALNTDQVTDAQRITPPMISVTNNKEKLTNPIQITGTINMSMPLDMIASAYHPITITQTEHLYQIDLQSTQVSMDRDFVLKWRPQVGQKPKAALFNERKSNNDDNENYLMLMLMPPQFLPDENRLPREMLFVIDTSGSMNGTSIRQAKSSLSYALTRLSEQDSFNIIEFNSQTQALFSQSVMADKNNINQAQNFVSSLQAGGGTEMAPALIAALKDNIGEGFLRQVVFITDGSVGNETQLFSIIHTHLKEARLFTIGIGSAPNSYFMTKAAHFGRGSFTYIGTVDEVQQKMSALFNKLESPVLSHLSIEWPQKSEVYPERVPDLYMGEPLIVSAKIAELKGEVIIKGQTQQGSWQRKINLQQGGQHNGISTIWARSKISALMDKKIDNQSTESETKSQVIEVALQHQLLSKYTSFIAVDETPVRDNADAIRKESVANLLPEGQSIQQIRKNYSFPQTATPATRNIIIGLLILLLLIITHLKKSALFEAFRA
ncbi:MAG: marine proteobacterial sortase target protein [gamma proteobacterium symbiont of Bathyaustriella thionipta]|nr:marine proteobacterial sortase target protein [gamma proteobacterium symbiont of Bathyaustriella thionipta]MCU7949600.1 marine proteobacterial sortase target protein [gamma proteobacterium symbiont of Bathyaustriella thionipta]MCU7953310.1 marine proteobacterial sortase target protein [gamma proteobacterium symbiont of Bathyaustriella thionipta]MCU7956192.1 marine proteobacterial sortase target protein [gamma proteobacterium symbiont of Bathyaustriella thionipta]MCU7968492.1 marine proteobac